MHLDRRQFGLFQKQQESQMWLEDDEPKEWTGVRDVGKVDTSLFLQNFK